MTLQSIFSASRGLSRLARHLAFCGLALACTPAVHAQHVWGINGHPNYQEYQVWVPAAVSKQFDYLNELGVSYYRVSFSESKNDPSVLDKLVPPSQARNKKIQIVPIVFQEPAPAAGYQNNYNAGYAQGKRWADYALSKGYVISHWELGNETSNASVNGKALFSRTGNGVEMNQWSDNVPGATEAMAGVLRGLYWGIKDAYRTRGLDTKVLFGDLWTHFGYVRKLMAVQGANFLPADILSWHWYTPSFGTFTRPLVDGQRATSPAAYAAEFGKEIWMTEIGREIKVKKFPEGTLVPVGGSADNPYNGNENWSYQSTELTSELNDLLSVPQVKGIFVYQLYDENITFQNAAPEVKSSQAFYGLLNANRDRKTAFFTYRNYIGSHP